MLPGVAVRLTGAARFTISVVGAKRVSVPLTPFTVSESAYGSALVVVFMVSVAVPPPTIVAGLKPPLVIPVPKPDSLPTVRATEPAKPV